MKAHPGLPWVPPLHLRPPPHTHTGSLHCPYGSGTPTLSHRPTRPSTPCHTLSHAATSHPVTPCHAGNCSLHHTFRVWGHQWHSSHPTPPQPTLKPRDFPCPSPFLPPSLPCPSGPACMCSTPHTPPHLLSCPSPPSLPTLLLSSLPPLSAPGPVCACVSSAPHTPPCPILMLAPLLPPCPLPLRPCLRVSSAWPPSVCWSGGAAVAACLCGRLRRRSWQRR